jgi:hypothetical protein
MESQTPAISAATPRPITIRFLTGKEVAFPGFSATRTVEELKAEVQRVEGIPPDQLRLIIRGREMADDLRMIAEYGWFPDDTIQGVLKLRGGGGSVTPGGFVDVRAGAMVSCRISDSAPRWRAVLPGLILCAACNNPNCAAHGREVLVSRQYVARYDIIGARLRCPECNTILPVTNCGFFDCDYEWSGAVSGAAAPESSSGSTQPGAAEFYDAEKCGRADWTYLMFTASRAERPTRTDARKPVIDALLRTIQKIEALPVGEVTIERAICMCAILERMRL